MKRYIKFLPAMLLLFAGCMLWSAAASRYRELNIGYGGISLRFETNPPVIDSLAEIRKRQKETGADSNLTAWRQDYNLKIEDPSLGLCIESDVVYMWGDGKDLPGLFGAAGCVMSGDKAYELWGSLDVLGKTVYIDGVSCKVTGVTDSILEIIAVRKDDYERDMKFVSLDMKPESDRDELDAQIEEFMLQNSYNADSSINYSVLLSLLGNFLIFPALTIFALMFGRILYGLYSTIKFKKGRRSIAYYIVFLILWICICFFAGSFSFEIPGSLIPTKWSDFDFWSRLIKRYMDNLKGLRLMQSYALDLYFRKSFIYISACGLLSSACFAAALLCLSNKSLNRLFAVETLFAFIMFYAAAALGTQYGRYVSAYWILLPVYYIFDFYLRTFRK